MPAQETAAAAPAKAPARETPPPPADPPVAGKKFSLATLLQYRKALIGVAALFLLLFLGYGVWLIVGSFLGGPKQQPVVETKQQEQAAAPAVNEDLISSISLDEIRQFQVDNAVIGRIMVIQGVAVNTSNIHKDFIVVEARILDGDGNTLGQPIQQLCGVPLTLFQLQSLSAEELNAALNNRITILTYNTNIPPGERVPFVVVFPAPPANMKRFEVRVISVQDATTP